MKEQAKLSSFQQWYQQNQDFAGKYIVVVLVAITQGISALSDLSLSFLYKDDFKMSPAQVAITQGLIGLPWIFKPIWGIISDTIPIFGQRRKSYIIMFSFLSFANWMTLAFYVTEQNQGIIVLFLIQLSTAFCNVVGEALIVELSQLKSKKFNYTDQQQQNEAASNVSLFFGVKSCGTLATAYLGGYLLQKYEKHKIFAMTGMFPLLLCIASIFMKNEEKKEQQQSNCQLKKEKSNFKKFLGFLRKPQIYKPIIFILMFMMTPTSSGSMFFFYTNVLKFQPQFLGQIKFIYAFGSILAIFIYNKFLKNVEFKKQFTWSTFLCVIIGLSQILLVTRWNLQLGIPDKLFCIGDSIFIQVIGELNTMPILVLACRMCPKSIEGTMYAMIMSTINLGNSLSLQLGGVITYYLGINEYNFDNLWILIVIANITTAMPLVFINMITIDSSNKDDDEEEGDIYSDEKQQLINNYQIKNDEDEMII